MTLSFIALKDSLNKAFRLLKPSRKELNKFIISDASLPIHSFKSKFL